MAFLISVMQIIYIQYSKIDLLALYDTYVLWNVIGKSPNRKQSFELVGSVCSVCASQEVQPNFRFKLIVCKPC